MESARRHDRKLRSQAFHTPDFFFEDGTWLEATCSGNSAYKQRLKYGHQANTLGVLWLDEDEVLHQSACLAVVSPKAKIASVERYYDESKLRGGGRLVRKLELLKETKGISL